MLEQGQQGLDWIMVNKANGSECVKRSTRTRSKTNNKDDEQATMCQWGGAGKANMCQGGGEGQENVYQGGGAEQLIMHQGE